MKINKFWFGFLLAVSIMAIPMAFVYADAARGYNSIGGEVFMIALPYLIFKWRLWSIEQRQKEWKRRNLKPLS